MEKGTGTLCAGAAGAAADEEHDRHASQRSTRFEGATKLPRRLIVRDFRVVRDQNPPFKVLKKKNPPFKDSVRSDVSAILEGAENEYAAAEEDPLPDIAGLRITGEAFPGRELQACGYSMYGTTSCNFEWVRHLKDGSVKFIEGARQPTYLVTADDVDTLLAVKVEPLDEQNRRGEIMSVYANGQKRITCDPDMKEVIKRIVSIGHVSYEVLLPAPVLETWEPAVLAMKREGYSIKRNGQRGVVIKEKFQQATAISIPSEHPTEFSIKSAEGRQYNVKPAENSPSRDTIVLILRVFRMQAIEKSRARRWGIFYK